VAEAIDAAQSPPTLSQWYDEQNEQTPQVQKQARRDMRGGTMRQVLKASLCCAP